MIDGCLAVLQLWEVWRVHSELSGRTTTDSARMLCRGDTRGIPSLFLNLFVHSHSPFSHSLLRLKYSVSCLWSESQLEIFARRSFILLTAHSLWPCVALKAHSSIYHRWLLVLVSKLSVVRELRMGSKIAPCHTSRVNVSCMLCTVHVDTVVQQRLQLLKGLFKTVSSLVSLQLNSFFTQWEEGKVKG